MNRTVTAPQSPSPAVAFTLATALAWIGHDCTGGCPPLAMHIPASVWFVPRSSDAHQSWASTLVVVELGETDPAAAQIRPLLRDVNRCTSRNHIQVRERAATDQGHALAALGVQPARSSEPLYLRPIDPAAHHAGPGRGQAPPPTDATLPSRADAQMMS